MAKIGFIDRVKKATRSFFDAYDKKVSQPLRSVYHHKIATTFTGNPSAWDIGRIRRVVRDLAVNDPLIRRYTLLMDSQVLGQEGAMPMFAKSDMNTDRRKETAKMLIEKFNHWCRETTIDGRQDFRSLQSYILRSLLIDGEVLLRRRQDRDSTYKLQPIDVDFLNEEVAKGSLQTGGNYISHGIEVDSDGRPIYFHFHHTDSDISEWNNYLITHKGRFKRPASEFIYYAEKFYANQVRGVSDFVASINTTAQIGKYDDATLKSMIISNMFSLFIENSGAVGTNPDDQEDDLSQEPLSLESGSINYLDAGQKMNSFMPNSPGFNQSHNRTELLKKGAAGLNISYNNLVGDWSNTSYSSAKAIMLADRDMYKLYRKKVERVLSVIWRDWVMAYLPIMLTKSDKEFFMNPQWRGRSFSWLDPQKELVPCIMAVEKGIAPPQIFANLLGYTAQEMADKWREDEDLGLVKRVGGIKKEEHKDKINDNIDVDLHNESKMKMNNNNSQANEETKKAVNIV